MVPHGRDKLAEVELPRLRRAEIGRETAAQAVDGMAMRTIFLFEEQPLAGVRIARGEDGPARLLGFVLPDEHHRQE